MMKTLCVVAVVVLSLTSVCQPAPLACDKLLTKVDKSPDLSGRWYLIAMSSDVCLIPVLFNVIFWPSIAVDIAAKATPNIYEDNFKLNIYGYCASETESFLLQNNTMFDVDENNALSGDKEVLLQTGCSDCFVAKEEDTVDTLLLFSRRKTLSAEELKEFETQAECLGWSKPQILNTDHEYEKCKSLDDDATDVDFSALKNTMYQQLQTKYREPLQCFTGDLLNSVFEWLKEEWNDLW
ncbi:uncharacterized protein LOC113155050 [Anabas testudineus]|uniref:uncharacterized protein LOC113155050 n=1 Tax=Anabas testudineus TaxID=64144 RepID=UPI000E45ED44|nr:uncharacterized protein LOC113155050 [Anabas testudineus]